MVKRKENVGFIFEESKKKMGFEKGKKKTSANL